VSARAAAALCALACACGPISDPGEGCPLPCPPSCPDSCLPTGYCEAVRITVDASPGLLLGLSPLPFALGDLPPLAPVVLSGHALLDFPSRHGLAAWPYTIDLFLYEAPDRIWVNGAHEYLGVVFPVALDFSRERLTSPAGLLLVSLDAACKGDLTCLLVPGSSLEARLVDPSPWSTAPACK
jgi:hypothetical protein